MTDFVLPPFVVDYGGWWIHVDLDGDLEAWAGQAAREVLARWGMNRRRSIGKLATMLAEAGRSARKAEGAISALLLYPVPGEGLRGGVLLFPVDMSGHDEASGWQALLDDFLPPELRKEVQPQITEIQTPAGTCRRVRFEQCPGGPGGPVVEQLAYLWVFPQYGAGMIMSITFPSLAEAGRWRDAVEKLAMAARLDETAGLPAS
jgi:hypothetical protein